MTSERQRRALAPLAVLGLAALLAGCGGDGEDLRDYVETVKRQPAGDIPPLPQVKAYEPFEYPGHRRDPFDASVVARQLLPQKKGGGGVHIDPNRPREYLERFPLDSLKMVGTLQQKGQLWALIRTPDGTVQRVGVGNYLGQNHGRIKRITETGVELVEIVPDGFGGYMERPARIALSKP